jgi:uncharacterized coiled-coil protein SlyX
MGLNNKYSNSYTPYQQLQQDRDENDERIKNLGDKISRLKDIAIEINDEVSTQNKFYDNISLNMDNLQRKLSNIIMSVKDLINSGSNGKYLWYAIGLFILFMFLIIFFKR